MKIDMTRDEMLRAEVSRRLAASGAPHDHEATTAAIASVRKDVAEFLESYALALVQCPNVECGCLAAATIYHSIAGEVLEASA